MSEVIEEMDLSEQLSNTRESLYQAVKKTEIRDPEAIAATERWRPE